MNTDYLQCHAGRMCLGCPYKDCIRSCAKKTAEEVEMTKCGFAKVPDRRYGKFADSYRIGGYQ